MVKVKGITDHFVSVSLLEYNNIDGMIVLSELVKNQTRRSHPAGPPSSTVKVSYQFPVNELCVASIRTRVARVDLSKTKVSRKDVLACQKQYRKSRLVHSILCRGTDTLSLNLEDLYTAIGWPLYCRDIHAYDALKLIVNDPTSILNSRTMEVKEVSPNGEVLTMVLPAVTKELKDVLIMNIRRMIAPESFKIRATVELKCYQFDGVLHIQNRGLSVLESAIKACSEEIEVYGGTLLVKKQQELWVNGRRIGDVHSNEVDVDADSE